MNGFTIDFKDMTSNLYQTLGLDKGRAQINFLAPTVTYLGTRFITSLVFAINPLDALAYEILAATVDTLAGPIFAKTGNLNFRNSATTLIPFTFVLIIGFSPLAATGLAVTSLISRLIVSKFDDNSTYIN